MVIKCPSGHSEFPLLSVVNVNFEIFIGGADRHFLYEIIKLFCTGA